MLANAAKFFLNGPNPEQSAWDAANGLKKSAFALKYAIEDADWTVPRYVAEGLAWLASVGMPAEAGPEEVKVEVAIPEEAAVGE
jgi:putative ATP-dependent endonuclease of OLD family